MKSILFFGKEDDEHTRRALEFCCLNYDVTYYLGKWGDPFPEIAMVDAPDYIISYLSRWIIPTDVLDLAKGASINFHPGSPSYPGIGCLNFALYQESMWYGVTAHHMLPAVDTGGIIAYQDFRVFDSDTVYTLHSRTQDYLLNLFYDVVGDLPVVPSSRMKWIKKPYTRSQFNSLFEIRYGMGEEEVRRRIRATSFGKYRPYMKHGNYRFELSNGE